MKVAALAAALSALVLLLPGAARSDTATITASCTTSGGTGECGSGWYTTDVTVKFSVSGGTNATGCSNQSVDSDTAGTTFRCTVDLSDGSVVGKVVTIKRDATPPTATGIAAERAPDNGGWYNHAVGIAVSGSDATSGISACTSTTYAGPDSASASITGQCVDNAGNVSPTQTLTIQYDATAPSISAAPARAADSGGWYNHALAVAFQGSDAVSGIDSCAGGTYGGPDSASAAVTGTCRDKAGNTATASFGFHYDATPPAVTGATPDRPPDLNGWYNHRLVVGFTGSDAASGVASCDAVAYDKPTDASARVSGRCRDVAGNVSQPATYGFRFDSTPPKLAKLNVDSQGSQVALAWTASADVSTVKILRTRKGARKQVTLYSGKRITSFTDKRVASGGTYTYLVEAFDKAGNSIVGKGIVGSSGSLLSPPASATIRGGTTLRWHPAGGATYYNVQLWREGKKVLTTWPAGPSLTLSKLPPGHYEWLVWPGLGARSDHRYGSLIGRSTFVVKG